MKRAKIRQEDHYNAGTKAKQFNMGDLVWARNFQGRERWIPGIIKERIGNVMYKVVIEDKDMTWRQHTNQLKSQLAPCTIPDSVQPTSQGSEVNCPNPTNNEQLPTQPPPLRRSAQVPKPR